MAQLDAVAEREALEVSVIVVWGNDAFILGWYRAHCVTGDGQHVRPQASPQLERGWAIAISGM